MAICANCNRRPPVWFVLMICSSGGICRRRFIVSETACPNEPQSKDPNQWLIVRSIWLTS